jgi:large subunit ribosomal protein L15
MKLNELQPKPGSTKRKMRVGRGIGSGKGKTSGRGVKGQKARTGVAVKGFEGGQMPLYRRLPKVGFTNASFKRKLAELSIGKLQAAIDAKQIDTKGVITEEALLKAGVVTRKKDGIKLLGNGAIKSKVSLKISGATASAKAAVEKAGGSVEIIEIVVKPVERKKPKSNNA